VSAPADEPFVPYVAHDEFRAGLPHGRMRVVVNPALVKPYIVQRTRVNVLAMALIGAGAALALGGQTLPGVVLVALGIVAHRLVRHQAARIVLHLALKDPALYAEVTSNGVMEVRRAP
jgi:hypothetical protein